MFYVQKSHFVHSIPKCTADSIDSEGKNERIKGKKKVVRNKTVSGYTLPTLKLIQTAEEKNATTLGSVGEN